jgi:hypothetical protein
MWSLLRPSQARILPMAETKGVSLGQLIGPEQFLQKRQTY